jgi:nitrite reductase/ring-hydroxylating ferredoxin subunit
MAIALFVVGAPALAAKAENEATHDGTVVRITKSNLVMTSKDGHEHSHTLAKDAKVTLDGKACKVQDLKAGTKIRVTTQATDAKVATQVEAIDKNTMFANTHDGKFVSMDKDKFVMSSTDGKEHSHTLSTDAAVTCDGKTCKLSDLKAGMKIRVTTKASDIGVATEIEAIEKNRKFT